MRRHITRERERNYLNHKHVKGYVNYRLTQIAKMEMPVYILTERKNTFIRIC